MSSLFLFSSHAGAPFVHRLHGDLTKRGFTVWIDETSIPPGAVMREKSEGGIYQCAYFFVTLSPDLCKAGLAFKGRGNSNLVK